MGTADATDATDADGAVERVSAGAGLHPMLVRRTQRRSARFIGEEAYAARQRRGPGMHARLDAL